MQPRFNYAKLSPGGYHAMFNLEKYIAQCGLEESLLLLIKLRVSQINGCAFCLDMHWKDLRSIGEDEQRLYSLDAWRECPYYTDRERSALAWAEALTLITHGHVSDTVYAEASAYLNEKELSDFAFAIVAINAWNRLAISSRTVPGTYQPAKTHETAAV
ncbi:MAG TPA: carboxymuconolactone decarboxylase family protein [Edaphobacter sp.]|nr:carboxymuconolactone decarboxylase family protein [Edaphobacter sp.]